MSVFWQIEKLAEDDIRAVEYTLEDDLRSFGRGFTVLEKVPSSSKAFPFQSIECNITDAMVLAISLLFFGQGL